MGVESAGDLAGFFDCDEFGVAASYLPSSGGSTAVTVILDLPDATPSLGRLGVTAIGPSAQIRLCDLPAGSPADGDRLRVTMAGRVVTFAVVGGQAELTARVMRLALNEVDA